MSALALVRDDRSTIRRPITHPTNQPPPLPLVIDQFNREADYLEAAATAIDPKRQVVKCTGIQGDNISEFEVEYDRLVVAVGARVNTFGIPGITENCSFLKQVDDARVIRRKIVNLFEKANYPGQSEEQLRKLLTFAVIGAGPTGVEFAAELRDFIEEDGPKYYPKLLKYVSIKLIEASSVVLRPFDEQLQENAKQVLTRPVSNKNKEIIGLFREDLTELIIDTPVKEVTADEIVLGNGQVVPYGLAVWAGGIGPLPITLQIIEAIGGMQNRAQKVARGKIAVDPWLRAVEGQGKIFALGDCVCTQNNVSFTRTLSRLRAMRENGIHISDESFILARSLSCSVSQLQLKLRLKRASSLLIC